MAQSAIEKEYLKLTKIKAKSGETRQKFLSRVYNAAETLFDSDNKDADSNWEEVSEEAQNWYTDANKRAKGAEIEDFPDVEAEAEEDAEAEEETEDADDANADDGDGDSDEDDDKKVKAKKMDKDKNKKAAKPDKAKAAKNARPDPKAKKAASNGNGKKPAKEARASKPRGDGKCAQILGVIWANPKKNAEAIHSIVEAKGATCSQSTVSTLRSDFMRSVNFLHKKGAIENNPFAE